MCVCPVKALRVGSSGSELVYYNESSLAPELLINGITAAGSVSAELHNSHFREERRRRRRKKRGRRRKTSMGGMWKIEEVCSPK